MAPPPAGVGAVDEAPGGGGGGGVWPVTGVDIDWPTLARLTVHSFYSGSPPPDLAWDALTGATALDALRTGLRQRLTMQEIRGGDAFGALGAAGFVWVNMAALVGGLGCRGQAAGLPGWVRESTPGVLRSWMQRLELPEPGRAAWELLRP